MSIIIDKGTALLRNGYQIVPIKPGKKYPGLNDWSQLNVNEDDLKQYAANGFAKGGVGVLAKHTPGIDIDVHDKAITREVIRHVTSVLDGDEALLLRVGLPPKALIPCQTSEPFTKVSSRVWVDIMGVEHKLEVLGDGQQWVAYGIHPDTNRPYRWRGKSADPAVVERSHLPELTQSVAQSLVRWFEDQCTDWGWEPKTGSSVVVGSVNLVNPDDVADVDDVTTDDTGAWLHDSTHGIDASEMADRLSQLDPSMMMSEWVQIGMACYHESGGALWGLGAWESWSSSSPKYRSGEMQSRWNSFSQRSGDQRSPITWSTVVAKTQQVAARANSSVLNDLLEQVETCLTVDELTVDVCESIQMCAFETDLSAAVMAQLEHAVGVAFKRLSGGARLPVDDIRGLIRPETHAARLVAQGAGVVERLFPWAIDWVYVTTGDYFYHTDMGRVVTEKGFNAMYNRCLLGSGMDDRVVGDGTDDNSDIVEHRGDGHGDGHGDTVSFASGDDGRLTIQAADLAKTVIQIPIVDDVMYMPSADTLFNVEKRHYANSYQPGPVMVDGDGSGWLEPWEWTDEGRAAVALIEAHFAAIVPGDRDRAIMLAYLAQRTKPGCAGTKVRWAMLIQGMPGDGKTFIQTMMGAVLGEANCRAINASETEEKYNGWAHGHQMVFIEELKMHGHNRWDVVNKLKPLITNDLISVRDMRISSVQKINVTDYIAFTNYTDGLPVSDGDRRWFITFSALQSLGDLEAHIQRVVDRGLLGVVDGIEDMSKDDLMLLYFNQLYSAARSQGATLGGWLRYIVNETDYLAPGFNAQGRAPGTSAKKVVIETTQHLLNDAIKDIIEDDTYPEINAKTINLNRLNQVLELTDIETFHHTKLNSVLGDLGFIYHSRLRIPNPTGGMGIRSRFYSRFDEHEKLMKIDENGVGRME